MIKETSKGTEEIRAFIALDLPPEGRSTLGYIQEQIKLSQVARWVRWVDPKGIHLTLKFLGNVAPSTVHPITQAMERASGNFGPFLVRLSTLGAFPTLARPRVIWAGLEGEVEGVNALQKKVEAALAPLGFPKEGRGFSPHLTLGRVREGAPREALGQLAMLVNSTPASGGEALPIMRLETLSLIRSQLTPQGAIYTPLATITLAHSKASR